jgi:hypothetical protein
MLCTLFVVRELGDDLMGRPLTPPDCRSTRRFFPLSQYLRKTRFESNATLFQSHFLKGSARRKKHERLMDSQGCGKTVKINPSTTIVITHIVQVFWSLRKLSSPVDIVPHWWTAYLRPESKNSDVE